MKKLLLIVLFLPVSVFAHNGEVHTATSTPLAILQNIVDTDGRPEIIVTKDGAMTLRNVKIMQIAGTTLFTRLNWESMYLRLTIKTNKDTKFYRRFGEATTLKELTVGDYLNVDGILEAGGDSFSMNAKNVVDLAVLKEQSEFWGNVGAVDSAQNAFTLYSTKYGPIRVNVGSAPITKGSLTIVTPALSAGDKILSVSGEYNHADKTLLATAVNVYIDLKPFKPRNYTATLTTIDSSTSLTVKSEGKSYTVMLTDATMIKNKARNTAPLKRFVEGDELVVYGATSESAPTTIVAEVIRNLSL